MTTDSLKKLSSLWIKFSEWACDYHFRVICTPLYAVSAISRVWNILLMLHGLGIDFESGIGDISSFSPSIMNQIVARRTFFSSQLGFRSGDKIVMDSTIGYQAVLDAGIHVHRSIIRTFGAVQESTYDDKFRPDNTTIGNLIFDEVRSFLFFLMVCISVIPAYEAFLLIQTYQLSIVGAPMAAVVWYFTWLVFGLVAQSVAVCLMKRKASFPHLAASWYQLLLQVHWFGTVWGREFLMHGTPFYNSIARVMGASIEAELLFNGRRMVDFHALTFQGRTIIDECYIRAHVQIQSTMTVEPSTHSGVLLEGCLTLAGSQCDGLTTTEYDPLRVIFGTKVEEETLQLGLASSSCKSMNGASLRHVPSSCECRTDRLVRESPRGWHR